MNVATNIIPSSPVKKAFFSAPKVITKNLAFNRVGGRRRVRLSTNFLSMMGFSPEDRVQVVPSKGMTGFSVVPDLFGEHKVHSRRYTKDNPLESIIEFASQSMIDAAFPSYTERMHIEMTRGRVVFSPMANRVHAIHSRLRKTKGLHAFVGLTGGVDIHCMEQLGWRAEVVVEWRSPEKRDGIRDFSEVNALNCLRNGSPSIVLNEDIYHIEIDRLQRLFAQAPPLALAHYSLQCDDYSLAKSGKAKAQSIEEGTSTLDMLYPMLKQIEVIQPAVVLIENVPAFAKSNAGTITELSLRRMGYHVSTETLSALDYGATQSRTRTYMVASIWPNYAPPAPIGRNETTLNDVILRHISDCGDVSNSSLLANRAAKKARGRELPPFITVDSTYCPTIMKSQDRVDDAVFVEHQGGVFRAKAGLIKELMSVPSSFDVSWMSVEKGIEVLGQGLDYKLHHAVMSSITDHVKQNMGTHTVVKHTLNR